MKYFVYTLHIFFGFSLGFTIVEAIEASYKKDYPRAGLYLGWSIFVLALMVCNTLLMIFAE